MISFLQGKILLKNEKDIILMVNQIGYRVSLSPIFLEQLKEEQELKLFIHTHVKEDLLDLYGFKTIEELDFFKQLISVSGVGPKSAVNILGLAKLDDLKKAITSGDPSILRQVSGIGKKTAERLVVELKEKIITDISEEFVFNKDDKQVVEALVSLGYKEKDVRDLIKDLEFEGDLASRVKTALQSMNK